MRKDVSMRIRTRPDGPGILALAVGLLAVGVLAVDPLAFAGGIPGGSLPAAIEDVFTPSVPDRPSEGRPSEIDALRELEARILRTIEDASKAFVFIEGGSGFLVSEDGYILTNEHVIGGKGETVVQLTTGRSYRARAVGHDPEGDVALLKIEGDGPFPFLELGDSSTLRIGDQVIALGDPFLLASMNLFLGGAPPDLQPSASFGVVSALHRYSDTYSDAIQVDVSVNRGNSGGPLITLDGKAVGINGKIETRFAIGINSGVGYAVPSNQIKNFLGSLKEANGGRVQHGSIAGLYLEERAEGGWGLPVRRVDEGSTAERAGFRKGDRIVAVEGLPVPTRNRYKGVVSTYPVGRELTVTLVRDDGPRDGAGGQPDGDDGKPDGDDGKPDGDDGKPDGDAPGVDDSGGDALGDGTLTGTGQTTLADRSGDGAPVSLELRVPVEPRGKAYLGIRMEDGPSGGVLVTGLVAGGAAEDAGIRVGDVILIFRGQRIAKVEDLAKVVAASAPGDDALVVVAREGKPFRIGLLLGSRGADGAGSPEAGSPEAGSPEAGSPEAGSPEAGSP